MRFDLNLNLICNASGVRLSQLRRKRRQFLPLGRNGIAALSVADLGRLLVCLLKVAVWTVHLSCFNLFYLADWGEVTFLVLHFF